MERIEMVKTALDALQLSQEALAHLLGTAQICGKLAQERGENRELAVIAGLLHDVSFYLTGSPVNHARRSAAWAENTLRVLACFGEEEIRQIHGAIYLHSDKETVHGPLAQILKEADILQKQEK